MFVKNNEACRVKNRQPNIIYITRGKRTHYSERVRGGIKEWSHEMRQLTTDYIFTHSKAISKDNETFLNQQFNCYPWCKGLWGTAVSHLSLFHSRCIHMYGLLCCMYIWDVIPQRFPQALLQAMFIDTWNRHMHNFKL